MSLIAATKNSIITLLPVLLLAPKAFLHAAEPAAPYAAYIPEDKKLDPKWVATLFEKGERKSYTGEELKYIAMSCGGIGAGQIEICGDGTLGSWWIFNQGQKANGGLGFSTGARYLKPATPDKPVENTFAIRIEPASGDPTVLWLDGRDFDDIHFFGEYPVATLDYRKHGAALPVAIQSEVFSPFVPLSVRDSANPVTVLRFTVKNISSQPVKISVGGWLQNATFPQKDEQRVNRVMRGDGVTGVLLATTSSAGQLSKVSPTASSSIVFDDFERDSFGANWIATGDAFAKGPVTVADLHLSRPVTGHQGIRIATSFPEEGKESLTGRLISKPFKIDHDTISFLIGGGNYRGKTCINLIIAGKTVFSETGENSNDLKLHKWDVREFRNKQGQLEIVDEETGPWGFVMVDDIRFSDLGEFAPPRGNGSHEFGNLALNVLDPQATASVNDASSADFLQHLKEESVSNPTMSPSMERSFAPAELGGGSVSSSFSLAPGESKSATFFVSWYFPNLNKSGRIYDNWYQNAFDVAKYVGGNFDRLYRETKLFRDTYFDTTLPYWLANRITMPLSTLACDNVSLWKNGRFYAFEGVAFCPGTCGHVYNFVTAIAHLFPELERSVRLQQDLNPAFGFDPDSGRVNYRGHDGTNAVAGNAYASNAQSGYVLKLYREYLMSSDRKFLDAVWPKAKKVIGYQIFEDGAGRGLEPNGVLKGLQTMWDPMWYGPNPYNESLYLAALRAAEEMARVEGEPKLADHYHELFVSGQKYMSGPMWNGKYFVHLYPNGFHGNGPDNGVITPKDEQRNAKDYIAAFNQGEPHYFVSTACDAQQIFGQNWAHQLNLGYILPPEQCRSAAESIFRYNWTPDISMVYKLYPPKNRTLAAFGEAAMVNGAWPKARRLGFENCHDKDDVWSGLEYESACDMINEGLLREALIMIRAVNDRYDGVKRNPWNEIEGAEHYSRAMHSWNILLSLGGFTYNGPAGQIGFAPKISPENFKCFFSGAEGWGSYSQTAGNGKMNATLSVRWGNLRLKTISLDLADGSKAATAKVFLSQTEIPATVKFSGSQATITFANEIRLVPGNDLQITVH